MNTSHEQSKFLQDTWLCISINVTYENYRHTWFSVYNNLASNGVTYVHIFCISWVHRSETSVVIINTISNKHMGLTITRSNRARYWWCHKYGDGNIYIIYIYDWRWDKNGIVWPSQLRGWYQVIVSPSEYTAYRLYLKCQMRYRYIDINLV